MKAWLQSLAPRERAVILGGGAVLLAVVLYLVAIEPAVQARAEREARVAELERELAWMRDAAAEIRAHGGAVPSANNGGDRPPYLATDRALREAGLPRPQRLEPVGSRGARMEIEGVAFDQLLRVLQRLRTSEGLRIERARFERTAPGRVDASVALERPQ